MTEPIGDLLDRADRLLAAGRGADAMATYDEVATLALAAGDLSAATRAVLGLSRGQRFDVGAGLLPARLHAVYVQVDDPVAKARLAATIARTWAYSGQPARAIGFADQAVAFARGGSDPAVLADCLDATLTAHWGPDDLSRRRAWAAELDETVAHLLESRARQQAHLWGLTVAFETLDLPAVHRQLRALERLGEQSAEARFFGASRRLAVDLLRGRFDTAAYLRSVARDAAAATFIADHENVLHAMTAYPALLAGDEETCADEAVVFEEFGLAEGSPTILAEGAWVWVGAGRLDRAAALVGHLSPNILAGLPRDADWLLTLQCTLEAAIATDALDVVDAATDLLTAYEGRAVINAGAVMFHGVTDDTLARGHALLGHDATAHRLRDQALTTYQRIGASWWRARLERWSAPSARHAETFVLHPLPGGRLWRAGSATVPSVRGLGYLHLLLSAPGTDISALDLMSAGAGQATVLQADTGDLLDEQAIAAYRRRLTELDQLLGDNEDSRLSTERDALAEQLDAALGLGGRRRSTGSTAERARVAVRKAIVGALLRIAEVDPALGRHLYEHIRTGAVCRYEPGPLARWDLG
ncbi:hypothetical protein [Cryptosporangium sp. NPDC051539]|uniref:hypothetical protein n=1 Tax=Cryptosporangium sp. NPDC051539 TaxID=3363962 RepID=UPI0037A2C617